MDLAFQAATTGIISLQSFLKAPLWLVTIKISASDNACRFKHQTTGPRTATCLKIFTGSFIIYIFKQYYRYRLSLVPKQLLDPVGLPAEILLGYDQKSCA